MIVPLPSGPVGLCCLDPMISSLRAHPEHPIRLPPNASVAHLIREFSDSQGGHGCPLFRHCFSGRPTLCHFSQQAVLPSVIGGTIWTLRLISDLDEPAIQELQAQLWCSSMQPPSRSEGASRGRTNVLKDSQKDSLHGTAATPYWERSPVAPRPNVKDAPGDSDSVKCYRRFFETHDLHGLPQRDSQTTR